MKKMILITIIILIVIIGIIGYFILIKHANNSSGGSNENITENPEAVDATSSEEINVDTMVIRVSDTSHDITFALNDSVAAKSLYEQLPLTIEVENFSSNEKIFYPTDKLDIDDTPRAGGGEAGVLAYYEPWKDVVMFYDSFSRASGLYELGTAITGANQIESLSGKITIERLEN